MGFIGRSLLVLSVLYGLLFAVIDVFLLRGGAPVWVGAAFVIFLFGIQYLVSPWLIEWFFTIDWDPEALPAVHRAFVENLCRERGLPTLKLGVIWSDTPNAFAFGRLRRDARVVVTEGLLKALTIDEINAVIAHEVGHVAHYDFAVMALASICPLLLYQVYIWTDRVNNLRVVSYAAYIAYWFAQFLVLLLNRTREFGADHFSAEVTRQPSTLSSALVKISYGMIRETGEARRLMREGTGDEKKDAKRALQFGQSLSLMGIAAASGSEALSLVSNTPEAAAKVMRWDLVNPWSRVYELGSTHPLTAMRIRKIRQWGMSDQYRSILETAQAAGNVVECAQVTCVHCGSAVSAGDDFCAICGTRSTGVRTSLCCPNEDCRHPIRSSQLFCTKCGTSVGRTDPVVIA